MPEEKNYLPESGRIDLNPGPQDQSDGDKLPKSQNPEADRSINNKVSNETLSQEENPNVNVTKEVTVSDDNENLGSEEPSDGFTQIGDIPPKALAVIAIVTGILVMVIGVTAYRYFSSDNSDSPSAPIAEVTIEEGSDVTDLNANGQITSGVSSFRSNEWDDVDPSDYFGIVQEDPRLNNIAGLMDQAQAESESQPESRSTVRVASPQSDQLSGRWAANDYSEGDINPGSYTVVYGDTLWEIAEAAYGSGADWHKIADANNVSYLSNGNPLIITGQTINIPA